MPACILIAEDNEANLALVEYLLRAAGHRTVAATNGNEAVRLAREVRPDLVICDLQMPEVDGYGVLAQVREDPTLREMPVIALTAFSRRIDRTTVLVAGFDGYLSKPIDPEVFIEQVEQYLKPPQRTGGLPRKA